MSIFGTKRAAIRVAAIVLLAALASGCAYDYANHSDRVAFSAGNAVKANLEMETLNPSKKSMNRTSGLGKNGEVSSATQPQAQPQLQPQPGVM